MPGISAAFGIVRRHHHVVGHYVLLNGRIEPHLLHLAVELPIGKRIDAKAHRQAHFDRADIGFGQAGVDLHLFQVLRDLENVGVWKLAATVWPTSTLRATTTPEIGERITV